MMPSQILHSTLRKIIQAKLLNTPPADIPMYVAHLRYIADHAVDANRHARQTYYERAGDILVDIISTMDFAAEEFGLQSGAFNRATQLIGQIMNAAPYDRKNFFFAMHEIQDHAKRALMLAEQSRFADSRLALSQICDALEMVAMAYRVKGSCFTEIAKLLTT